MKERPPNLRRTQDEQPHQRDSYEPAHLAGRYVHLSSLLLEQPSVRSRSAPVLSLSFFQVFLAQSTYINQHCPHPLLIKQHQPITGSICSILVTATHLFRCRAYYPWLGQCIEWTEIDLLGAETEDWSGRYQTVDCLDRGMAHPSNKCT